ncbi:MAG: hypothetical protein LBU43_03740 [Candidatus Accumulibacter sp.]|nr:hypothetical protein [Accumulibacter sp.]
MNADLESGDWSADQQKIEQVEGGVAFLTLSKYKRRKREETHFESILLVMSEFRS